jgi:hypothetical protein
MQTFNTLRAMDKARSTRWRNFWLYQTEFKQQVRLTLVVAAFALLPILIISVAGQHYARILKDIPVELTNFQATLSMIGVAYHLKDYGDSWVPMLAALRTLHGSSGEEIYKTLFLAYGVPLIHPSANLYTGVGESIYKTLFFAYGIRFQYPLTSLLPLDLLSIVGPPSRSELSGLNFAIYCINAAGCGWLGWALFRSRVSNGDRSRVLIPDPLLMAGLVVVSAFLFYPLVRALVFGQIQVWINALFTCSLICWFYNRRFCAGVFIGLACAIKPQLGLLLIWGLLWREMRFSTGIFIAIAPLTAISLLRFGLQNYLGYLDVLAFLSRHGEIYFANNSVNGILNAYFSGRNNMVFDLPGLLPDVSIVYWGTLATSIVCLGLIIIPPLWKRHERPNIADFGAASICTVVGSPVAWEHHYGILLPLYLVTLRFIFGINDLVPRLFALAAIAISWILVADFIPFAHLFAQTPFRVVQAHCFFGALLLLALLYVFHGRTDFRGIELTREKETPASPRPIYSTT